MRLLILAVIFLFTGCAHITKQSSINDGDTRIVAPMNAKSPATLDKRESNIEIIHKKGDIIKTKEFKFYPEEGSITLVKSREILANTGNPYQDISKNITAILDGTRPVQYAGIGLIVIGILLTVVFRVYAQGFLLGASGAGVIILQSTLANPVWAWVMIGLVILIPFIWLYHLYKKDKTNKHIINAIEEYKEENPDQIKKIEDTLRSKMDKDDKIQVKKTKERIKK